MLPFITLKNIPELYLGAIENKRLALAFEIMELIQKKLPRENRLSGCDVSQFFVDSAIREIVLQLDRGNTKVFVRLNAGDFHKDIDRLAQLLPTLSANSCETIIDLRVPGIGLVKEEAL
ncbi:MAG TPA: hypothetical protein VN457_03775, partial [Chlamydiales bacterium]|nr:hypothetical protein [Chlamydiales bacterium]